LQGSHEKRIEKENVTEQREFKNGANLVNMPLDGNSTEVVNTDNKGYFSHLCFLKRLSGLVARHRDSMQPKLSWKIVYTKSEHRRTYIVKKKTRLLY